MRKNMPPKYISEETDVGIQLICLKGGVRIWIQARLRQFLHALSTVGMDVKITKAECWLRRHSRTCYYPLVLSPSVLPSGLGDSVVEVGRPHHSGLSTVRDAVIRCPDTPFRKEEFILSISPGCRECCQLIALSSQFSLGNALAFPWGSLYPVTDSQEHPLASGKDHVKLDNPSLRIPCGVSPCKSSCYRCWSLRHSLLNFFQANVCLKVWFLGSLTCSTFFMGFIPLCRTFLTFSPDTTCRPH